MVAVSFFALIFSSLVWLIYAFRFVAESLGGQSFFSAGSEVVVGALLVLFLPVFVMWVVFGGVNQYLQNRRTEGLFHKLFSQMKKNQDYSDLLARVLIETEQQVKEGFMMGRFDLLIADLNELLSEIIRCCKIASKEQIEHLWQQVRDGGKWTFGKVIIEVNNAQANFQMRVYEKACHDVVLAGTIMEFCARYQSVVGLLEKYDREKIFLNMIETGVMGKVFSIFAPVSDEVRKVRESTNAFVRPRSFGVEAQSAPITVRQETSAPIDAYREQKTPESLMSKINPFKKKPEIEEPVSKERDPFSIALERSFGAVDDPEPQLNTENEVFFDAVPQNEPVLEKEEPHFEISLPEETSLTNPEVSMPEVDMSQTQKQLNNLKEEWNGFKESPRVSDEDENFAYPFGGWMDEEKYSR